MHYMTFLFLLIIAFNTSVLYISVREAFPLKYELMNTTVHSLKSRYSQSMVILLFSISDSPISFTIIEFHYFTMRESRDSIQIIFVYLMLSCSLCPCCKEWQLVSLFYIKFQVRSKINVNGWAELPTGATTFSLTTGKYLLTQKYLLPVNISNRFWSRQMN